MPLILLIVLLVGLRFFEVWRFAELSWWYIVALMVFAFVWFEFIEKMLGLDKKKAHNENEKLRRDRVKKTFDKRK
ncbi:TIGR04438 family Trp-rich protein [Massilia horti]|uniref:TIGR04438 family Trp-rich protein n=1 Tax=Massilia horti TaxID=2562153 RepID=A0A4Y9SM65_9BURK|nr:TIGR04438 family Trp-rich protein [Massilia horti]TFW27531.1 TIGR04438 family Trp-rich protein [Massilia horti]